MRSKVQAGVVGKSRHQPQRNVVAVIASQSATGALQAAQAGNQLLALQSQQLSDLGLCRRQGRAEPGSCARTAAEARAAAVSTFSTRSGYVRQRHHVQRKLRRSRWNGETSSVPQPSSAPWPCLAFSLAANRWHAAVPNAGAVVIFTDPRRSFGRTAPLRPARAQDAEDRVARRSGRRTASASSAGRRGRPPSPRRVGQLPFAG